MPILAVALALFFWMTCCVLGLKQDLLTVQDTEVKELEPMMVVIMAMVTMLVWDVSNVSATHTSLLQRFYVVRSIMFRIIIYWHLVGLNKEPSQSKMYDENHRYIIIYHFYLEVILIKYWFLQLDPWLKKSSVYNCGCNQNRSLTTF